MLFALPAGAVAASESFSVEQLFRLLSQERDQEIPFEETRVLDVLQAPMNAEGHVRHEPPNTLIRKVERPYQQSLIIEGQEVTIKEDGRVIRQLHRDDDAGLAVLTRLLQALNDGESAELSDYFEIRLSGSRAEWELAMTPEASAARRRIAEVVLSGSEGWLEKVVIRESNGDRTETRFLR